MQIKKIVSIMQISIELKISTVHLQFSTGIANNKRQWLTVFLVSCQKYFQSNPRHPPHIREFHKFSSLHKKSSVLQPLKLLHLLAHFKLNGNNYSNTYKSSNLQYLITYLNLHLGIKPLSSYQHDIFFSKSLSN